MGFTSLIEVSVIFQTFFMVRVLVACFLDFGSLLETFWLPMGRKVTPQTPTIINFALESLIFRDFHVFVAPNRKIDPRDAQNYLPELQK